MRFPPGLNGPGEPATQGDRAPDGVRTRRWGAATRPPFRRGTVARRGGRTTRPLSVACILLDIGRSRQRWSRQRCACCIRSQRTSQPERCIGGSFQRHNPRSDRADILRRAGLPERGSRRFVPLARTASGAYRGSKWAGRWLSASCFGNSERLRRLPLRPGRRLLRGGLLRLLLAGDRHQHFLLPGRGLPWFLGAFLRSLGIRSGASDALA